MNFTGLLPKLRGKASSSHSQSEPESKQAKKRTKASERTLKFDLFAQLSYMASVATAGVSRSGLFEYAAQVPYSTGAYFHDIHIMARKLNIDYAEACRMKADQTTAQDVRGFLLRMAGSLASGEDEAEFLSREAEELGEMYGKQYERQIESLKKWTDAYVALVVAAGLIVIVTFISMMIYEVGVAFIAGVALAMVGATGLGTWIIYVSSPRETKTRITGPSSRDQLMATKLFKICVPLAFAVSMTLLVFGMDLGWVLMIAAAIVAPPGYFINRDDARVTKKDADVATMVRVIGGVASAVGTTVGDSLTKIDRRSMGALMPEVTLLRYRLKAGIEPNLCWDTLVNEAGSELIERTIQMFWDPISFGGEPGKVGNSAALFASKITFLRANRAMVAASFRWLTMPLHIALVSILAFIVEVMGLFSQGLQTDAGLLQEATSSSAASQAFSASSAFTFGQVNLQVVSILTTAVILVLTIANAFAPKGAEGGHSYKLVFNLAITMVISGFLMLAVPKMANSIFETITDISP